MGTATTVTLEQRLSDLFQFIRQGRILDAMHELYDQDVAMQQNANSPTLGLEANLEREQEFLKGVKAWKGFEVTGYAVGDDLTFYEAVFDWIATDGAPVHFEKVTVARWKNGKIVHERFYSDTGAPQR